MVHCETTSGILNPLKEVADVVARHRRSLLIDSMSAFGALPLDAREIEFDAVVASSNKCLEGAPGMGFCVARETALIETEGNSPSLVLDLYDQWRAMQANRQWRFTPPTHVLLAFDQALTEFDEEGGVAGRGGRYRAKLRPAGVRHARDGIQDPAAGRTAGADHHHLPHADQSRVRFPMPFTTASRTRVTLFIRAS